MTTCHFHVFLGHPSAAASSNGHTLHGNILSICVFLSYVLGHAETIIANSDGVDAASSAAVTDQCQSEKHQLVVATSKPPEKQSGSVVTPRWEH